MSDSQPSPVPSLTKSWHNKSYAAIDSKRPELSMEGKTVIVTGAGTGIGRQTAAAFAAAGATTVILFGGRREKLLSQAAAELRTDYPATEVSFLAADMADRAAIKAATTSIQHWDILVLNAGYLPDIGLITDVDLDDWTKAWDVNLSGNFQIIQSLLPKRRPDAAIIGTSSGAVNISPDLVELQVPYVVSKIGLIKAFEIFTGTYPDCHWVTFHPGIGAEDAHLTSDMMKLLADICSTVATDMFAKSSMAEEGFPTDDPALPANFAVWLACQESRFLQGRYVWCNWDVDEMIAMADEIRKGHLLTTNTVGWPFGFEPPIA